MIADIWASFRRMPTWVQIWVAVILVPVNTAALAFWTAPHGVLVACLAVGGMAPNLLVMVKERGFSKTMTWSHLFIWTPLVAILIWLLMQVGLPDGYARFLWLLLAVDVISLGFDYPDALKWLRGDRSVA